MKCAKRPYRRFVQQKEANEACVSSLCSRHERGSIAGPECVDIRSGIYESLADQGLAGVYGEI